MPAGDRRMRFFDRVLRSVQPTPVPGYGPPPHPLAEGVWTVERRLRLPLGLLLPCNMTVIRLPDAKLVVHSPVRLDQTTRQQLVAIGSVAAVIAPNSFHHLFASEYASAFPESRFYLAPGLPTRLPSCPSGTILTETVRADWFPELEFLVFGPVGPFSEVTFLHRPTSTLVLTDLAFNMRAIEGLVQRMAWRACGVPSGFGPSRTVRLTLLADRQTARAHLEKILRWDFDRIIVAHGDQVERNGRETFARAFRCAL
jgi:hypothetical protein